MICFYGRFIPMSEERLRQLGSWLDVNGEAIYSSIPWSHQNDTLTDKAWYVSNIAWCTYLEDNYIVFENITASIWDLMVANWAYWRRVKSTIVVVKCSNIIQLFPFKCNDVYRCALPHYWQDDVSDNRLKFEKYLMVFQPWKWHRAHYSIVQSQPGILNNYIRIMQINGTVKNIQITSVFYFHLSWSNIYVRSTTYLSWWHYHGCVFVYYYTVWRSDRPWVFFSA